MSAEGLDLKAKFIEILKSTNRKGVDDVIKGLEKMGFFEAPASSKHHLAHQGGLVRHSLNVYAQAIGIREVQVKFDETIAEKIPLASIAISALLHDVCKAEIYKVVEKFRKDKDGKWEKYTTYEADYHAQPLGHGEKSVIRLLRMGLDLTNDEILAIRWHMSNWDLSDSYEAKGNYNAASEKCPLLNVLIAADMLATKITEASVE